jgi:hypothetical protein
LHERWRDKLAGGAADFSVNAVPGPATSGLLAIALPLLLAFQVEVGGYGGVTDLVEHVLGRKLCHSIDGCKRT